jgi:integrase/recombinase XerD
MSAAQRHIDTFLEMLGIERGASANTIDAYRRDLASYSAYLSTRDTELIAAEAADVSGWLTATSAAGLSAASRARGLSAVRQLYKFLLAEGHVAADPTHGHSGPRKQRPLPKTLSVAEVDKLLAVAARRTEADDATEQVRALRLYCLIEMLYATGMRVSELVSLPRSVLAGDARMLTIKGKGGRERLVPLNASARTALDRYLAATTGEGRITVKWLFPSKSTPGPQSASRRGRPRPRTRKPARAAPRLRQPPARPRRRLAIGAAATRPCRYLDHRDLHPCAGGAPEEARQRAPSARQEALSDVKPLRPH